MTRHEHEIIDEIDRMAIVRTKEQYNESLVCLLSTMKQLNKQKKKKKKKKKNEANSQMNMNNTLSKSCRSDRGEDDSQVN
jgi:hypothetical protein